MSGGPQGEAARSDEAHEGPSGTRFRRLRGDDSIPHLTSLLHRAYAPLAAQGLRFVATHQDDEETRRRCASGECWVAEKDGAVVATVTWYRPWDDGKCPWYARPEVAHFGQFAVEPTLQGTGVGRALLELAAQRAAAAGYAELSCDTAAPATRLIEMYARWGFRRVGDVRWDAVNYPSVLLSRTLVTPRS
jgi:GNAT superfamily N-acetyltransferase